ncbi:MAG: hypothetical protein DDT21_00338 [Syntrophomonadaceae bacterium]|nr:hypothetical protein [Bacillota bacterium]
MIKSAKLAGDELTVVFKVNMPGKPSSSGTMMLVAGTSGWERVLVDGCEQDLSFSVNIGYKKGD